MTDEEVASLVTAYRRHFDGVASTQTQPFDGMRELVEEFAADPDILLGIATSKSRAGVVPLLREYGIVQYFDCVVCDEDVELKKPHPEMLRVLLRELDLPAGSAWMIGDTSFDVEMALAAGTGACGVVWVPPRRRLAVGRCSLHCANGRRSGPAERAHSRMTSTPVGCFRFAHIDG